MLDFGFSEILLTSAIALVVLGPERLPKVARQVGQWVGRARLMARQFSEQLEREVIAEELLKDSKPGAAGATAQAPPPHSVAISPLPPAAATPAAATPAVSPPPAAAAPPIANSPQLSTGADPTHTHQ